MRFYFWPEKTEQGKAFVSQSHCRKWPQTKIDFGMKKVLFSNSKNNSSQITQKWQRSIREEKFIISQFNLSFLPSV